MADADPTGHRVVPFRAERNATVDTLRWAGKRHHIPALLEVDVTDARQAIRAYRQASGSSLGFTAWVVSCVARAAAEHPRVHAIRKGRRKLVLFDAVDVAVPIERAIGEDGPGETVPMPAVIRGADRKHPAEIDAEIRAAVGADIAAGAASIERAGPPWLQALFFRLPAPIRDILVWRPLLRSPARVRRTMGTVAVTAVGMAAPGILVWGVPRSIHPLAIGVGGIARRATPDGDRDILALTVLFDHDVVDGAPVGRFVRRLCDLLVRTDLLEPGEPPR